MPDNGAPKQNQRSRRPTRWRRGDVIRADKLNEAVDAVNRLTGGVAAVQQIRQRGVRPAPEVRQFRVVSVEGDYLRCESQDGSYLNDGGEDVFNVAKPYLLRRSPFDATSGRNGITYAYSSDEARTATDTSDSSTEDQVVVPSYQVGDILYAVRGVTGGTGVRFTRGKEVVSVHWQDLNVDGRAWAKS